jgi:hypothetical protein
MDLSQHPLDSHQTSRPTQASPHNWFVVVVGDALSVGNQPIFNFRKNKSIFENV